VLTAAEAVAVVAVVAVVVVMAMVAVVPGLVVVLVRGSLVCRPLPCSTAKNVDPVSQ
jgi:hypothetical protein